MVSDAEKDFVQDSKDISSAMMVAGLSNSALRICRVGIRHRIALVDLLDVSYDFNRTATCIGLHIDVLEEVRTE